MKLLFKPQPFPKESLSSYIQHLANANSVTPHELWRLCSPIGSHYPQSSLSNLFDICWYSIFDLQKLSEMVSVDVNELNSLTLMEVYNKFGISNHINRSRTLSSLIHSHRFFCPECLKEQIFYKLIWEIKEIPYCSVHNISLSSTCTNCGKSIPIVPNSEIGICPSCNFQLKNNEISENISDSLYLREMEDWEYLLDPNSIGIVKINNLSIEQSIAFRILFLVSINPSSDLSDKESISLAVTKQVARKSLYTQKSIHLTTILY